MSIHTLRIHQCDSGAFLRGKTWIYVAQAGKPRTGRFSGARYGTLW